MQYRCNDCGELFESHHTNYKHAKGFHPNDNPTYSAALAQKFDHCETCNSKRTYNPVSARTRDLAAAAGGDSSILNELHAKVASLTAQVENAKGDRALAQSLQEQVAGLSKQLTELAGA